MSNRAYKPKSREAIGKPISQRKGLPKILNRIFQPWSGGLRCHAGKSISNRARTSAPNLGTQVETLNWRPRKVPMHRPSGGWPHAPWRRTHVLVNRSRPNPRRL